MNSGVINKEVIEFESSDRKSAFELKPEIFELASKNIPDIIDEVFLKYYGEDDFLRINKIEIDLGKIDRNNLRTDVIEKFYACFENEIEKIRRNQIKYNDVNISPNSIQMDFELLIYFLNTGVLPWWAVGKDKINFNEIIKYVINKLPGEFYDYLLSISSNDTVITRIVSQITNEAVEEVILFIKKKNESFNSLLRFTDYIFSGKNKNIISEELLNKSILETLLRQTAKIKINANMQLLSVELIALVARKVKLKKTFVIEFIEELFLKEDSTIAPVPIIVSEKKKYFMEIISFYKTNPETDVALLLSQIRDLLLDSSVNVAEKGVANPRILDEESKSYYQKKNDLSIDGEAEVGIIEKENRDSKNEEIKKDLKEIMNVKFGKEKSKDIHSEKRISSEEKADTKGKIKEKNSKATLEKDMTLIEKGSVHKGKSISKGKKELKTISDKNRISEEREDEKLSIVESNKGKNKSIITPETNISDYKNGIAETVKEETTQKLKPLSKEEEEKLLKERATLNVPEKIYIENSGLVLASAYIPALFARLNILGEDRFSSIESAVGGVHILQYLISGKAEAPEYELALNKILCGVDLLYPIEYKYEISDAEKNEVNNLLESMIKNWKALGGTSIEGLRESFFLRKGIITKDEEKFVLQVEQKAFDILLDRIPWSYSIIKHSWMNKPVYVEWR
jgi:hypothetical protein